MNALFKPARADLSATIIRAGRKPDEPLLLSSRKLNPALVREKLMAPLTFWRRLWLQLRQDGTIPLALGFGAFLAHYLGADPHVTQALVTTAGINLLAADFVSGAGTHIAAFNYHDCGTGAVAAAIGDVALGAAYGGARSVGTQSTPVAGQYRSIGTISFTSSLAITEWGLFSAANAGTLWDRRVFAAINVQNGDSIQFTYTLTCNAGGS
jgi:hypothetical protein